VSDLLKMPPCVCNDPECAETNKVVNEILEILQRKLPDHPNRLVATSCALARILVETEIGPESIYSIFLDQAEQIVGALALQHLRETLNATQDTNSRSTQPS
jgi:hypothetical protein